MSNFTIHHPHDGFFKHALSNLTVAKDLLRAHLSPSIQQRIRWDSLKLSNKSYTDEKLAQLHSDVVYTCQIDEKSSYIYILLEQQTKPDPLLPFRFLQYNVAMLTEHLSQTKKSQAQAKLPIILNLCLYSGKQTPYPYSVDIYDCFADPVLARAEMFKPLSLVDLGQLSEEELKKHGTADLMELLLKQSRERTFLNWIQENPEEIIKLIEGFYGMSGIHYILANERDHIPNQIIDAIIAITPHKKEVIMTAAQQLRQEGIQKGRQEGIQEGIQKGRQEGIQKGRQEGMYTKTLDIARNMLSKLHLDMKTVSEATGLSEEELMKLQEELSK
jgi:predicted transposase/invertase (TIGR01784 family)